MDERRRKEDGGVRVDESQKLAHIYSKPSMGDIPHPPSSFIFYIVCAKNACREAWF
jgi:hypothetical protein